jgi:hypothetical protein
MKEISQKMRLPEVNKMEVKIKNIIPKNWQYQEKKDLVSIWYKNPNKSPSPLTIKKQVRIDEKLGTFLGFWAGDGGKTKFSLTNNNILLLKNIYKNFKKCVGDIPLKLRVMIPPNFLDLKEEIAKEMKNVFPEIKEFKIDNYYKNRNQPIYQLINSKTMVIEFIKFLHNFISENLPKKESFWGGYLKGIISAEGHMEIRKRYNTLSRVSIAQEDTKIRYNIFESLKARNIKYYFDKRYIKISGKDNYNIMFKRGLYNLHPIKKKQFLLGYSNIKQQQYSDEEAEFRILSELKMPIRVSEIAKRLNRQRQTIREHMQLKPNSLIYRQLIQKCGKEIGSRGSLYGELWTLTPKGLNYMNHKQSLEIGLIEK